MKTIILSTALIFTMILSAILMLTACGGSSDDSAGSTPAPSETQAETEAP